METWLGARIGIVRGFTRFAAAIALQIGGLGASFSSCAHDDAGADDVPSSGQTGDEGTRFVRPRCSTSENFGPDEPYRSYTCAHENVDPTWRQGDATPAGSYYCICSGSPGETIDSESCAEALVAACGVDLAAPTPCANGDAACWPVRDQPGAWRCQCDADSPISENLVAEHCMNAMSEVCGTAPESICDEAANGEAQSSAPDAGQPLSDMACGTLP